MSRTKNSYGPILKMLDEIQSENFSQMISQGDDPELNCLIDKLNQTVSILKEKFQSHTEMSLDLSRLKIAEITEKKNLSILNETGRLAKIGGWELDVSTGELNWTDQTFTILGVENNGLRKPVLPEGLALFTAEAAPLVEKAVQRAIEFGEPYDLEVEALTAKGERVWVRTNGKANYENGKVKSLSGTIQDISEQKRKDEELKTIHLTMLQTSKMVSLGEMSAGIAHEINNPLGIISGSVKLLPKFVGNPEKLALKIEVIEKSCQRIAKIVNGLRKFSRSGDSVVFGIHPISLIIKDVIVLVEAKSKAQSVQISVECSFEASIFCNEIEIEQVLINLVNNGIDAASEQKDKWVKILIFTQGPEVVLQVIDSGLGVPEIVRSRIFDPFFTTKKVDDGTGLGLSIAKGIMDQHKATLKLLDNSPNTCFEIRFPLGLEKKNAA